MPGICGLVLLDGKKHGKDGNAAVLIIQWALGKGEK